MWILAQQMHSRPLRIQQDYGHIIIFDVNSTKKLVFMRPSSGLENLGVLRSFPNPQPTSVMPLDVEGVGLGSPSFLGFTTNMTTFAGPDAGNIESSLDSAVQFEGRCGKMKLTDSDKCNMQKRYHSHVKTSILFFENIHTTNRGSQ